MQSALYQISIQQELSVYLSCSQVKISTTTHHKMHFHSNRPTTNTRLNEWRSFYHPFLDKRSLAKSYKRPVCKSLPSSVSLRKRNLFPSWFPVPTTKTSDQSQKRIVESKSMQRSELSGERKENIIEMSWRNEVRTEDDTFTFLLSRHDLAVRRLSNCYVHVHRPVLLLWLMVVNDLWS